MADAKKNEKHLKLEPLDTEKFIKMNGLKPITNPVFFDRSGVPTEDGLLSNEIFGVTKSDRTNIFAYVELAGETFMHPLAYKTWCRLDSNVKLCAYEMDTFKLDKEIGKLKSDPDGETGLKFLRKIIDKVDFKKTNSIGRGARIDFIEKYREKLFTKNLIIIPAGYRDINTDSGKRLGVGEINKIYDTIIRDVNALKESDDYGLSLNGSLRGRIQDNLVAIYDWIMFGRFNGEDAQASGLSRKLGLIRRAGMKKSFDWGARMVICTQNLRVENLKDIRVDTDSIGIPLAALCANFFPQMLFTIRQWFENTLTDLKYTEVVWAKNIHKHSREELAEWRIMYSDERIKKELDRFMHGYSNRFIPIEAPIPEEAKRKGARYYLRFQGRNTSADETAGEKWDKGEINNIESYPLETRPLTWCDLIYQAAMDITKDKMTLITRFPVDSYWNQFPAKIKVLSTIKTEPLIIGNTFYPEYPMIREKDIGKNTSSTFIDVALPNNVRLDSIGGDFDGDTISSKTPYSIEANEELYEETNKKSHYISLSGLNDMNVDKEGMQSLYNLTLVLDPDKNKLTDKIELA